MTDHLSNVIVTQCQKQDNSDASTFSKKLFIYNIKEKKEINYEQIYSSITLKLKVK